MTDTSEITRLSAVPVPEQTADMRYALVITNDGELVENSIHNTRTERRIACVEALRGTAGDDVPDSEVEELLRDWDDTDPDGAVGQVSVLYAEFGVDVYLEDQLVPAQPDRGVPPVVYSVLVSYTKSPNTIEHFTSIPDQAEYLRRRVRGLIGEEQPVTTPTGTLARRLQTALNNLLDEQVTVHLATSERPDWGI